MINRIIITQCTNIVDFMIFYPRLYVHYRIS